VSARKARRCGSSNHYFTKGELTNYSVIPILHNRHIGHERILRNFDVGQDQEFNFTITGAILATLASPPLFTPASISNLEYISGDLKYSNPTLMLVSEAYDAFGEEARLACLLNIGTGHPGFLSPPSNSDSDSWNQFLEKVVKDSERKAEEIDSQIGGLGLYHRFSVSRGLEGERQTDTATIRDTIEYTMVYLAEVVVSRKLEISVDSLRLRDGVAPLGQLSRSISIHRKESSLTFTQNIPAVKRSCHRLYLYRQGHS
jgi:hypothetical protein